MRACATAIMVMLCSVLGWSTAHADDEIYRENVAPSSSATPVVSSARESSDKNDSEKDSIDSQKTAEKQKPNTDPSANLPDVSVVPVPVPLPALPAAILPPPNPLPMPALGQPTASPDVPVIAATSEPTASPDAPVISATAEPTASADAPAVAATAQPTASTGTVADSDAKSNQTESSSSGETPTEASRTPPIDPALLPDPAIVDPTGGIAAEAEVADEPWTGERTIALLTERAIAHGSAVYEVLAVARCETGYTFMPWRENGNLRRGSLGEVGVGQWLPPVEQNHWGRTPHWREYRYHILAAYVQGDPNAIWWDADALAWSMGPAAPAGFRSGWSCWRMRGPWWFV
jgi:hypothetical protein